MIPRRPRLWWGFGLGSAALLATLAWASVAVYRLETRNAEARALSQRQEVIRRALWRVDSQLAPIIAMEAARPADGSAMFAPPADGLAFSETMLSSNTTRDAVPQQAANIFADGFFVIGPEGTVRASDEQTRMAAAAVNQRERARSPEPTIAGVESLELNDRAAGEAALATDDQQAAVATNTGQEPEPDTYESTYDFAARTQVANIARQSDLRSAPAQEQPRVGRSDQEAVASKSASAETAPINADRQAFGRSAADHTSETALADGFPSPTAPALTLTGRVEAVWVTPGQSSEPELLLVRVIDTPEGRRSQGVRLDWPGLRSMLEASVEDLLPTTTLIPARGNALQSERAGRAYRLATIPALLVPGGTQAMPAERMTPAFWALLVTWIATLIALVAVASVLHATLRLSDRRARFVGAVTHELRTPLTTFRLYAQMLAGGMVTEESAKAEYLGTLERESVRLGEIVENVLEYARLTRRRPGDARPPGERSITPSELIARVRPVLSRRAEQSGMDLIVSIDRSAEADSARAATCDPRSVERILMNLVENACKYAGPGWESDNEPSSDDDADTRIHLDVRATDRALEILTSDHGPGVPPRQRERIFGEFQRGPGAAESSRPGLGLGLALSRGLAREMGGDLRLIRRRGHGAEFLLTIPLDPQSP